MSSIKIYPLLFEPALLSGIPASRRWCQTLMGIALLQEIDRERAYATSSPAGQILLHLQSLQGKGM